MISRWQKIDLHIHTDKSKATKHDDYEGTFSVTMLAEKVIENQVDMISLTDHNIINCEAYEEILKVDSFETLVGVELDIATTEDVLKVYIEGLDAGGDKVIEIKPFHILAIFKSKDYRKLNETLDSMYASISKKELSHSVDLNSKLKLRTTTFRYLFEFFREEDFFIISHGDKSKGIVKPYVKSGNLADAQHSILMGEISALEMKSDIKLDSTIKKYNQGFKKFLEEGYEKFPTSYVVFTDNHCCEKYSSSDMCSWLKGHLDYESLRIGFSDPESRIHTSNKPPRHVTNYIEKIVIAPSGCEQRELALSPYLNVIIGGRSSGKSLLFNTLLAQNDAVPAQEKKLFNDIYSTQIDTTNTFVKLNTSELSAKYSLKADAYCQEKIINLFNDGKDLKNSLNEYFDDFDPKEVRTEEEKVEDVFNELKSSYREYVEALNQIEKGDRSTQIVNSAKESNKLFDLNLSELELAYDLEHHENLQEKLTDLGNSLDELTGLQFKGSDLFTLEEIEQIQSVSKMLAQKVMHIEVSRRQTELKEIFIGKVELINTEYIENELAQEFQLIESSKSTIKSDVRDYAKFFRAKLKLRKVSDDLEQFHVSIADKENETVSYKFVAKLNFNICKDVIIENLFQSNFLNYNTSNSIFKNLLNVADPRNLSSRIKGITGIDGKLPDNFDKKVANFVKEFKPKKDYLIIEKGESEISTSATSQGRKASIFLDVKLNSYFDGSDHSVLMIDQIEDNIDNKYISENLVSIIRRLKNKMQVILVTHNPSIAIYGDAENIIICDNNGEEIKYKQGGLENETVRKEACQILDGGDVAFRNRMEKYNIEKLKSSTVSGVH